ncbi:MAG: valyl-tRNA synthetase [Bradymonadia bacterium]|jgi:valyl-tRNA synthetase
MSEQTVSELKTKYDHHGLEERWYQRWMDGGYFAADVDSEKPPYTIAIPPPNVTGSLHIGHALTLTIQDVLIRWKRMSGFNTLWLPGTDHAGIATQMVVERKLAAEGRNRLEMGREAFLAQVWAWKDEYHANITRQMKALGASVDWDRERFTMDDGLSKAVREVFVTLYEQGLIYQDDRLVNWSPGCQTVLSDLEVEHEESQGFMWHVAYPVADSDEQLVVATTRPETMVGDTAVAVHPDDPRYQHLIGKEIELPLTGRRIPIVADEILVDMAFGTGAVKVTPAHDFNDFEVGKRHDLEMIPLLDRDAKMNANAPAKYQGMDRFDARKAIVADLEAMGLMVKIEPHTKQLGRCQRSNSVVEPMLSKQWYVKADVLAKPAADAVRNGDTKIVPKNWEKTYFHWMDNIQPWCISRQLWWGHRIPAWTCEDCGAIIVQREDPTACDACGSADIHQDEDVLDTWFSSGLWPFSTLGWPDKTPDLKTFYPTQVMETGSDIIFFWVARMMMMGLHFMGEVPFDTVFLHAMVRDESGQKMSKTKGNVIDPLTVSSEFGADALRMTLALLAGQGRDIKLSMDQVKLNRNFVNKVYNACRFALMNLEDFDASQPAPARLNRIDQWILTRLDVTTEKVNSALEAFQLNEAANAAYQFFWGEICDWYIELAKPILYNDDNDDAARYATQHTLARVLDKALRLLHPFIPFASEEIWASLPLGKDRPEALIVADFPKVGDVPRDEAALAAIESVQAIITGVRNIRGELNLGSKVVPTVLRCPDAATVELLESERALLSRLGRMEPLTIQVEGDRPKGSGIQLAGAVEVCVPLVGLIDFKEEIARLDKTLAKTQKLRDGVARKLSNEKFLSRAPAEILAKEQAKLAGFDETIATLTASRTRIAALAV